VLNIVIRVDASMQIGTGHFMRCLVLADALKQLGAQIFFVCRHIPEYLQEMLVAKGHVLLPLDGRQSKEDELDGLSHAHWLGTSQALDAEDTIRVLPDNAWDWVIVDHYALDICWESTLRQTAKQMLVIDDIADREHDCDILLDQNFYADMDARYIGKVPTDCKLLLGPRYALLRDEFRQLREQIQVRTGPVKRLLVFFGGVDAANLTGRAIEALKSMDVRGLHVDVVIGWQHPYREKIEDECVQQGFTCHVQTLRMAELMAVADLAIGAGGSAVWERCCLGLPAFTVYAADNQLRQVADVASEGLLYAPTLIGGLPQTISRHLGALLENDFLRYSMSNKALGMVDGRGVLRVIGSMDCSGINIRVARKEDAIQLFEWRNHPMIRGISRESDVICWDDHQRWFASVLDSLDSALLIGQRDGLPVGVVHFDIQGEEAEVSIYLVPESKQAGQGSALLQSAESWFAANYHGVCKLRADVLGGNVRSQRLFLSANYQVESTRYLKRLR